jgi:cytochrome P450
MTVHDIEYKGVLLKAGDLILLPTTLAGIDERQFPDPFTVNFQRKDKRNLVFGRGPHQCIGAFLGRTELRVFLTEWLKRIPHFGIKPGAEVVSITGRANSIPTLPLVW